MLADDSLHAIGGFLPFLLDFMPYKRISHDVEGIEADSNRHCLDSSKCMSLIADCVKANVREGLFLCFLFSSIFYVIFSFPFFITKLYLSIKMR